MAFKQIAGAVAFVFLATAGLAQSNRDGDRMEGQISFGFDGQDYSTGRTSSIASLDATIRLLPRLTLETAATGGVYFGEHFGGGAAYVTLKPDAKTYLAGGGSRNSDTRTTATWSASLEAGRTLYRSDGNGVRRPSAIRALETDLNVTERGYHLSPAINILLVNPAAVVYFPRDWVLTLRAGAIRETIGGASAWTPSGGVNLRVPLTRRLSISPEAAFDSELSNVLQINNVSSREFGAAGHYWLTRNTSVSAYYMRVLYGANHLANHSYGVSYVLRF
jgi:hypothetical protein